MRKAILALTTLLLLYWLPVDAVSIRTGLEGQPTLALGISLKILMHLLAILGLALDRTFGYAFLLGASLQGLLISYGALQVIPWQYWWDYRSQLYVPGIDAILRVISLSFVVVHSRRLVGIGGAR